MNFIQRWLLDHNIKALQNKRDLSEQDAETLERMVRYREDTGQ